MTQQFDPVINQMIEHFYQMGLMCREQGCILHVERWVTDWMRENDLTSRVLYGWLVVAFQDGYNGTALIFE